MSAAVQQFHFLRPWWLLMLAALPLLLGLAARRGGARVELSRLVDPELLPYLLQGRPRGRALPLGLFALGWTLAALAMAGPAWDRVAQPLYASRAAQVVAISLSRRMLAHDVAPSRLDRAKYKARDLLAGNRDGLNALVAYAGDAFVVAPLTSDAHSLNDLLDALSPDTMPVDGDNAAAAIDRGAALIRDAKAGGGSLVLIADRLDAAARDAAARARAAGVVVSVLGVGTPQGGPVALAGGGFLRDAQGRMELGGRDDASLAAVAAAGGGRYVPMSDGRGDLDALHGELRHGDLSAARGEQGDEWQDRGPWLLLPLLPLAALAFRRGWLLLLPLLLWPLLPAPAQAASWRDLWLRPDQQAARALQHNEARQALQLARDPALRGAAAYRAGDYDTAARALAQAKGGDAQYNLGNALAKRGDYQQAIAAYDRALKLDPRNADAAANRKAVEDWLRRRQQSSPQQDKNGSGQGSQQKPQQGQPSPGQNGQQHQQGSQPQQDQDRNGQPQNGQQGGQNHPQNGNDNGQQQPGQNGQNGSQQAKPMTPEEQAAEQAKAEQAREALRKQLDQNLGKPGQDGQQPHELGALDQDDPQARLPAEVRQALQRVPDDPGALLRRKFELEYRQRHGGAGPEEDSP
jgi:Ca-activated chloride channel family protein